MNATHIGIVLVRLFSIYLVVMSAQSLTYVLPALFDFAFGRGTGGVDWTMFGSVGLWLGITNIGLPMFVAWWLWRNAERVLPADADASEINAGAADLMLVGVSVLGLYLLVWGLISVARVEAGIASARRFDAEASVASRIPALFQLVLAVLLLVGRQRISEFLLRLKTAGRPAGSGQ